MLQRFQRVLELATGHRVSKEIFGHPGNLTCLHVLRTLIREREAGLNGIFRMLDMDRTGKIPKKTVEMLTSQATERAAKSGMLGWFRSH